MNCVLFSADSVIIVDLSCHCILVVFSPLKGFHVPVSMDSSLINSTSPFLDIPDTV